MEFGCGSDGGITAVADGDFESVALEDFFKTEKDVGVVFDDQDFDFHIGFKGKVRAKQLPPPSRGS